MPVFQFHKHLTRFDNLATRSSVQNLAGRGVRNLVWAGIVELREAKKILAFVDKLTRLKKT